MENAAQVELTDLWTPMGLILGFQMTLFAWRLQREAAFFDEGKRVWLTPSDSLGIIGLTVLAAGGFILPLLGAFSIYDVRTCLGLGVLLFIAQLVGLCGHYQLFGTIKERRKHWICIEEFLILLFFVLCAVAFLSIRYDF